MKLYLICGEPSGDLHSSNLIKAIKTLKPETQFRCWAGDETLKTGAEVVKHIRDLAFMGFVEVIANLPTILKNISFCKADILAYKPDALVLVDYPGFNLRIAKWAKEQGIKVIYYISPQVWAWKESRVKSIKQVVDKMLVILPFEKEFYAKWDYHVSFVGHPLLDVVKDFHPKEVIRKTEKPLVALLPGSRQMEITKMLGIMLETTKMNPQFDYVLAASSTLPDEVFNEARNLPNIQIVKGQTYSVLAQADAALVTSGTATLETALFQVPEVVCYKGNVISYFIARSLIKIKYISLVNLILDRPLVTELIQHHLTPQKLSKELNLLFDETTRSKMKQGYVELKAMLGNEGASARAAKEIIEFL